MSERTGAGRPRALDPEPPTRARRLLNQLLPPPGPQRALVGSVLVVTVGGGILLGSSTLYLTRIVGMSAVEVGLALTVGAAAGLVAGPLVGHVADRRGPKQVHIGVMLCGAAATAGFVVARTFWALALVSLLTALVGAAGSASRAPLIRALAGDRSTWFLSYQRAVTNVGVMAGILIATIGIQLDTGPVYVALILSSAFTFLLACAILTRLPHVDPLPVEPAQRRWVALTDRPYLAVALVNGLISVHLAIPAFALPLWIVDSTTVPRAAITAVFILNGALVVGLQVRLSRGVVDPRSAGRRMRWAGLALLVASALIGATATLPTWPAVVVLLVAVVSYTFGELWHAAASFELAFSLAQPHAQGQYAGIFGLGQGAANAAGPAILAAVCLEQGLPGWLVLGGVLAAVCLPMPAIVRWASPGA
ncbi:MFS transporter [Saccharothrix syringae]|uniref:MFS transporter n=1 Tax=Saccharothrix syringae TaxID=103733 RepID=A0A5Q0H583_SACSY|nr:MFS transporter [Saccharothrix syringae]QFZ21357.1 MFS transporter [Saccharothrix syringae]